ncbi:unnamed protein product [Amoebophrya sp. A25]|nr:unnamed protein product [Amoebophrya sp. A25]
MTPQARRAIYFRPFWAQKCRPKGHPLGLTRLGPPSVFVKRVANFFSKNGVQKATQMSWAIFIKKVTASGTFCAAPVPSADVDGQRGAPLFGDCVAAPRHLPVLFRWARCAHCVGVSFLFPKWRKTPPVSFADSFVLVWQRSALLCV